MSRNNLAVIIIILAISVHYIDIGIGLRESSLSLGLLATGTTLLRVE